MIDRFYKYNTENELFRKEDKLLVAVSGGVDSVVLCHLLKSLNYNFSIAHCNFSLRNEESDADELFVEELAEDLEVTIHIKKFDTKSAVKNSGMSTQMVARELRYEWFKELAIKKEYNFILTAHHQNDLVETVLLNLVRGTGIAGLHGILPKKNNIIRPLLFATKDEIINYAVESNLKWREDSSNESNKYNRNLIRLEVIPLLKKINPNLEQTLKQSIEKISAAENIFNNYIEGCRIDFMAKHENHISLNFDFLKEESEPLIILFEIIRPFGFNYAQSENILQSINGESGSKFISASHILVKDRTQLIITKNNTLDFISEECLLKEGEPSLFIPWLNKELSIQTSQGFEKSNDTTTAYLNYKKLQFPLIIRRWSNGDFFYPFGMKGQKKVSDFLNDLKIPVNLKDNVTLLISNNEVVWIIGYRIDERYKAISDQKSIHLKIYG